MHLFKIYICLFITNIHALLWCTIHSLLMKLFTFSEQCHNLISGIYKTSCKTGAGVEEMFTDIARQLSDSNRSRKELESMDKDSFKVTPPEGEPEDTCMC